MCSSGDFRNGIFPNGIFPNGALRKGALRLLTCSAVFVALPVMAQQAPLSAIDWLSESIATPGAILRPVEPDIAKSGLAVPDEVVTSVLDGPSPDAAGLIAPSVSGLPRDLWGLGKTAEIVALLASERADALPALQQQFLTVLLAEATPPVDSGGKGVLLLARVDKLLKIGALEQAGALIEAAGAMKPDLFRRAFDIALLTGNEDAACAHLRQTPDLAPTYAARIFCLARSGDWNAAALTLQMAQALGYVSPAEDQLLSRFLDPALADDAPPLPPPDPVTPLTWRMLEAIGEGLPTGPLPLAFSHAELRDTAGWKARIEASERLARVGVIAPNQLLGIYTARLPAASGGVWDRVEAFQRFDTALSAGDPGAVARALPDAFARMAEAELEVPFADLFAARLMRLPLTGDVGALAFRIALLSPQYESAARNRLPQDGMEAFLIGLAKGNLQGVSPPDSLARAIAPAFVRPAPPPDLTELVTQNRLGEAILTAIDRISRGLEGDIRGVTEGLSLLRQIGLDDLTRRTALELMLLERRG